jgi:hypothetical protein
MSISQCISNIQCLVKPWVSHLPDHLISLLYQPPVAPTVITDVPSIVTSNYSFTSTSEAVMGGTVTSDGGAEVTARGI